MYIFANLLSNPTGMAIVAISVSLLTLILSHLIAVSKQKTLKQKLALEVEQANKKAQEITKTAKLDAAAELIKRRDEANEEFNQTRNELREQERRLSRREDVNQRQAEQVDAKEKKLTNLEKDLQNRQKHIQVRETELNEVTAEQRKMLLKITDMDFNSARDLLLTRLESECE